MDIFRKVWRKLPFSRKQNDFQIVTDEDIYYYYRLLLDREPDETGWLHWTELAREHKLTLDFIVDSFMRGEEFRQRQAEQHKPRLLVTDEDIYYCYRLLLNREPDKTERAYWIELAREQKLTLDFIVDNFMRGEEFRQRQAERHKPHLVQLPEFRMYVRLNDHFFGAAIARSKMYEPHVTQVLRSKLEPGATFIDVGANIGYFTLMAASLVGDNGQVIAFEPRPDNCELLRQSREENGFDHIKLHEKAVAERQQVVAFVNAGGVDTNGRLLAPSAVQSQESPPVMVETVTLDETVADAKRVDLIKMDIEGAEPKAWQGMQQIIKQHRPYLVFEFSPGLIQITSQAQPLSFLRDIHAHYELYDIDHHTGVSKTPRTPEELLRMQSASGMLHLDLLASPR